MSSSVVSSSATRWSQCYRETVDVVKLTGRRDGVEKRTGRRDWRERREKEREREKKPVRERERKKNLMIYKILCFEIK